MFIVIEGIDGAGTTTISKMLRDKLKERYKNKDVILNTNPSNGKIGLMIREILSGKLKLCDKSIMHLFIADRHDNIESVIKPNLQKGNIVISDRYAFSTWVYQQLFIDVKYVEKAMHKVLRPDYVFLLDVDTKVALERINKKKSMDIYEKFKTLDKARLLYHESIKDDVISRIFYDDKKIKKMSIDTTSLDIERVFDLVYNFYVK